MALKQQIEQDLLDAMRVKDEIRRNTLRMVIAAVKLHEVEKSKTAIDDATLLAIIQKEIKSRRDSLTEFEKGKRQDLIEATSMEIAVLEKYLPKQLSSAEIEGIVKQSIAEVGATSPADMGKVMKAVLGKVAGQAPSDIVSKVVRSLLTQE
jgi:uncharacterized protein YqeY